MSQHTNEQQLLTGQIGLTPEGLAWAALMADHGISVMAGDPDEEVTAGIADEVMPGETPGLRTLVSKNLNKNLTLYNTPRRIYKDCTLIFINGAMPLNEDNKPSLRFLEPLLRQCAFQCSQDTTVVIRSTVLPRQFDHLKMMVDQLCGEREDPISITLCVMPVFKGGDLLKSMSGKMPQVVGCDGNIPENLMHCLTVFPLFRNRIQICSPAEACLMAFGFSGFQALRQTYFEEMIRLSHGIGVSPAMVKKGLSLLMTASDDSTMNIGAGFGGTDLVRHTRALAGQEKDAGIRQSLTEHVLDARDRHRLKLIHRLCKEIKPKGKTIAVLGLSPLADTDDLRETPALNIVSALISKGAVIQLFLPCGMDQVKWRFYKERDAMAFCNTPAEACNNADVLIILGKWRGMNRLLTKSLTKRMKGDTVYDVVCGLDPEKVRRLGLNYKN